MSEEMKTVVTEPTTTTAEVPAGASEVRAKLAEYGADESTIKKIVEELGAESMEDLMALEVSDLISAGLKPAKARRLDAELKTNGKATATPVAATAETRAIQDQLAVLLPTIPNDESWLNDLKTGGIIKVDDSTYIAAIRAALADRAGLYNIPSTLAKEMEKYADEAEEQVDKTFFSLRSALTRRSYGDIFSAIDGLDGTFVTETRRKELLSRINETLWPAIAESFRTLDAWYQNWRSSFTDPSMILATIGGGLNGRPVGMVTPPDVAPLHDAGDTLVNAINRVFRGTGVQIAAAMAYEANSIRKTLDNPQLPSMIGVKNREMMLKKIGANVSSNYVRLEQNLVKYVLAFVNHNTVTSDVETNYFMALWNLGVQINWAELGCANTVGITGLTGDRVL